jgi:hypothetical protein
MWTDPIVKETRELGDKYTAKFAYNLEDIFNDLKEKEKAHEVVCFNPKPYLQILKKQLPAGLSITDHKVAKNG